MKGFVGIIIQLSVPIFIQLICHRVRRIRVMWWFSRGIFSEKFILRKFSGENLDKRQFTFHQFFQQTQKFLSTNVDFYFVLQLNQTRYKNSTCFDVIENLKIFKTMMLCEKKNVITVPKILLLSKNQCISILASSGTSNEFNIIETKHTCPDSYWQDGLFNDLIFRFEILNWICIELESQYTKEEYYI